MGQAMARITNAVGSCGSAIGAKQLTLKYTSSIILYILAFPPSFSRYLLTKTHFILILLKGVLFCKKDFCPILFHRIHT